MPRSIASRDWWIMPTAPPSPKSIRLWEWLHEFERPGLVPDYFLESGLFRDLERWSLRGLPRPADDKYADRLTHSDPLYAVWGLRR